MTGYECLKEELLKRKYSKTQVESQVVAGVLDVIANSGGYYRDVQAENEEQKRKLERFSSEIHYYEKKIDDLKRRQQAEDRILKDKIETYNEMKGYIESFNSSLTNCETPEGRDAMRRAQVFINAVDIDSKYDNTAFIIGLASILSDGKFGAMDQLKKMNPKLFERDLVDVYHGSVRRL